jgi:hypothetical protein
MIAPAQFAPKLTPDYFSQAARVGQDAMDAVIRAWGNTWQQFMGIHGENSSLVPDTDALIDSWYDITGEALAAGCELTKTILALSQPAFAAAVHAAQQAATATQQVTEQSILAAEPVTIAERTTAAQRPDLEERTTAAQRTDTAKRTGAGGRTSAAPGRTAAARTNAAGRKNTRAE